MQISEKKILKQFMNDSSAIICGHCEGQGARPMTAFEDGEFFSPESCPVCKGKGFNIFKVQLELLFDCKLCDGNGRGWDEDGHFMGEQCVVCSGSGIIAVDPEKDAIDLLPNKDLFWNIIEPEVIQVSKKRFDDNQYADAVEASLKEVNSIVKELYKVSAGVELDGKSLMTQAFSPKNPILKLADLSTDSGKNIQEGFMYLFAGAIQGVRNPKAHENITISKEKAIHFIFLASILVKKLKEANLL